MKFEILTFGFWHRFLGFSMFLVCLCLKKFRFWAFSILKEFSAKKILNCEISKLQNIEFWDLEFWEFFWVFWYVFIFLFQKSSLFWCLGICLIWKNSFHFWWIWKRIVLDFETFYHEILGVFLLGIWVF